MPSATLTPYKNNAAQTTFALVSSSPTGSRYIVSGRGLAVPHSLEIVRKLTTSGASGNDRIELRVSRVEANATTGKMATLVVTLSISIPKDNSILDATAQKEAVSYISSILNESTVMEATTAAITALIEGRDL